MSTHTSHSIRQQFSFFVFICSKTFVLKHCLYSGYVVDVTLASECFSSGVGKLYFHFLCQDLFGSDELSKYMHHVLRIIVVMFWTNI